LDVGYWKDDYLVRLLLSTGIEFEVDNLDQINKQIEIAGWFDRETLLEHILKPQNLFLDRIFNMHANMFIKEDPYVDVLLEERKKLVSSYLRSFQKYLTTQQYSDLIEPLDMIELLAIHNNRKLIKIDNLTRNLLEIYKHSNKFAYFSYDLLKAFNFDFESILTCNFKNLIN
jgi:hypothetical protein